MTYVLPSRRNKPEVKPLPDDVKQKSAVVRCKWCHETTHLSIFCKYKGTVLDKRPELECPDTFPNLPTSSSTSSNNDVSNGWGSGLSLTDLKDKIKPSSSLQEMKRVNSSMVSLDTLSTIEHTQEEINEFITCSNKQFEFCHPYEAYYSDFHDNDLNSGQFKKWYNVIHLQTCV